MCQLTYSLLNTKGLTSIKPFAFGSLSYFNEQEAISAATSRSPLLPPTSGKKHTPYDKLKHDTTLYPNFEMRKQRANKADDNVRSEFSKWVNVFIELTVTFGS